MLNKFWSYIDRKVTNVLNISEDEQLELSRKNISEHRKGLGFFIVPMIVALMAVLPMLFALQHFSNHIDSKYYFEIAGALWVLFFIIYFSGVNWIKKETQRKLGTNY